MSFRDSVMFYMGLLSLISLITLCRAVIVVLCSQTWPSLKEENYNLIFWKGEKLILTSKDWSRWMKLGKCRSLEVKLCRRLEWQVFDWDDMKGVLMFKWDFWLDWVSRTVLKGIDWGKKRQSRWLNSREIFLKKKL